MRVAILLIANADLIVVVVVGVVYLVRHIVDRSKRL